MGKPKMKFVCKECGKEAQPDSDKSTKQWDVMPAKCESCGGKFRIEMS